jgi:hypothetical protein
MTFLDSGKKKAPRSFLRGALGVLVAFDQRAQDLKAPVGLVLIAVLVVLQIMGGEP